MYAQDTGLREQIHIKQGHPRLSTTKTLLLMGIFSGYMLENIKVKQLLSKGRFEFVLRTASYTEVKVTLCLYSQQNLPQGLLQRHRMFPALCPLVPGLE